MFQCSPGMMEGEDLSSEDLSYLKSLGLLEDGEEIMIFSSSLSMKSSGNFFTDKRIASYWQYDKTPKDNYIKSAKYYEISSIDAKYGGARYAPKLIVNLKNNTSFEVYFDCENEQIDQIHIEVSKYLKK